MSEALTANVCNASAYASSTDTEFEHEKCRRPLTLRVCTANVPVYVCLAITSVAMPLAIGAHWYDSSRGTRGLSAASIASKRGSTSSLLGLEEPASLEMVRRPKYNITENYFKSDFIPVPNLTAKQKEWPALFCWLLMQTVDHNPLGWSEEKIVKHQLLRGIGIFSCNGWAVMTDVLVALNRWGARGFPIIPGGKPNRWVDMASWAIGDTQAQKGAQTNPLNSIVFRTAWNALRGSKQLQSHDWVVKVDPDAVWFPERLRAHLKMHTPGHGNGLDNIYLKNCQRFNTMQGPIEVISKKAALSVAAHIKSCGGVYGSGEDQFMEHCLKQLDIGGLMEQTLLNDLYCDGYSNCKDHWKVAFHPHKSSFAFDQCYNESLLAETQHFR